MHNHYGSYLPITDVTPGQTVYFLPHRFDEFFDDWRDHLMEISKDSSPTPEEFLLFVIRDQCLQGVAIKFGDRIGFTGVVVTGDPPTDFQEDDDGIPWVLPWIDLSQGKNDCLVFHTAWAALSAGVCWHMDGHPFQKAFQNACAPHYQRFVDAIKIAKFNNETSNQPNSWLIPSLLAPSKN